MLGVSAASALRILLRAYQDRRIDVYKHQEFPDIQAHDVLVRAVDARVLPVPSLPDALVERRQPRHPEFEAAGKTAWRLFNAVTEAIKGSPPKAERYHPCWVNSDSERRDAAVRIRRGTALLVLAVILSEAKDTAVGRSCGR
jgi:hypothetical protein